MSPRVRWPGSARVWLAFVGVSGALLVAACSTAGRPGSATHSDGSAPGTHSAGPGQVRAADRPVEEAATVRIVPAPYQLPSGVAQAAVLPHGPGLLILGGLNQRSKATASVLRLNPVTGSATPAGRLAAATPGAAGATLNGRDYLFGGGQAGTAPGQLMTVQQIGAGAARPPRPGGCPPPGPGWPQ